VSGDNREKERKLVEVYSELGLRDKAEKLYIDFVIGQIEM